MWQALVFDVNETLLDLAALDPLFERLFGDAGARRDWFGRVLTSAMTLTCCGRYEPFDVIGARALTVTARHYDRPLGDGDTGAVGAAMRRLPPHPEVPAALDRLRAAGHRLVALTNSPAAAMQDQLDASGLAGRFDLAISVEAAGALKPAPAVYALAAERLGAAPADLLMIAAHGWDIAGAGAAGMDTAFVARPGQYPDPLFPAPGITGRDLDAVAAAILARTPG